MNEPSGSENSSVIFQKTSGVSSFGSASAVPKEFVIGGKSAAARGRYDVVGTGAGDVPKRCHKKRPAARVKRTKARRSRHCFSWFEKDTAKKQRGTEAQKSRLFCASVPLCFIYPVRRRERVPYTIPQRKRNRPCDSSEEMAWRARPS